MCSKPQKGLFSSSIAFVCLLLLLALCTNRAALADSSSSNILCRPNLSESRREEIARHLRGITGWTNLGFKENGELRIDGEIDGGSQTAREFLTAAASGKHILVLEDASNRSDVVFCRVVEGRWTRDVDKKPPAFIVLVDFADFARVTGDRAALAAFNVGWGVLHEIAHVVNDSSDAESVDEVGECEEFINRMRRECGLAERAEYFYTKFPGTEHGAFSTEYVRLAFEQQQPDKNRKRRYWLVWDARAVGVSRAPGASER